MTNKRRPALKFFGSKWQLAPWIISNFPPHEHYIEPCFGGGNVLLRKQPVKLETINDIDNRIVNFFTMLRDYPEDLIRQINLTPWAEIEYHRAKEESGNDLEDARRYFVACWMSINGGPMWTGWRSQARAEGRWSIIPNDLSRHDLEFVASRLKNVQITNRDAIEVIERFGHDPDGLIYFDPPYLKETRTMKTGYGANEVDIQFHRDAASALSRCKAKVVISGFNSDLYNNLYRGWIRIDKEGAFASSNKRRVESLWIRD